MAGGFDARELQHRLEHVEQPVGLDHGLAQGFAVGLGAGRSVGHVAARPHGGDRPGPAADRHPALVAGPRGAFRFEESLEVDRGAVRGGADVIELGVPFSDPIADGPTIQRASERALLAGGSLARSLAQVRSLREDGMRWVSQGATSLEEVVRVTRE